MNLYIQDKSCKYNFNVFIWFNYFLIMSLLTCTSILHDLVYEESVLMYRTNKQMKQSLKLKKNFMPTTANVIERVINSLQ
jgi:hypothetical protein